MKKCDDSKKFITMTTTEATSTVTCFLRGEFVDAELCSDELTELYALSDRYDNLVLNINSAGGIVSTCVELIGITKLFNSVITIAVGEVQSAAFLLWMCGDLRVVHPYTTCMIHREGSGFYGKTNAHLDNAAHLDKLYSVMLHDIVCGVLTDEE